MNMSGQMFAQDKPVNNIDLLEPKQILHETFKRITKLLTLNREIYLKMKISMPTLLDARDYVASIDKLMKQFEHTADFYEKFLLMNVHYYKSLREDSTVSTLLESHAKELMRFAEITKNKNYIAFPPPNCSVLNPDTANELLVSGSSPNTPGLKVITDGDSETIKDTLKDTGVYGMTNIFKEYIHIRELVEIVKMHGKMSAAMAGGGTRSLEDKIDSLIEFMTLSNYKNAALMAQNKTDATIAQSLQTLTDLVLQLQAKIEGIQSSAPVVKNYYEEKNTSYGDELQKMKQNTIASRAKIAELENKLANEQHSSAEERAALQGEIEKHKNNIMNIYNAINQLYADRDNNTEILKNEIQKLMNDVSGDKAAMLKLEELANEKFAQESLQPVTYPTPPPPPPIEVRDPDYDSKKPRSELPPPPSPILQPQNPEKPRVRPPPLLKNKQPQKSLDEPEQQPSSYPTPPPEPPIEVRDPDYDSKKTRSELPPPPSPILQPQNPDQPQKPVDEPKQSEPPKTDPDQLQNPDPSKIPPPPPPPGEKPINKIPLTKPENPDDPPKKPQQQQKEIMKKLDAQSDISLALTRSITNRRDLLEGTDSSNSDTTNSGWSAGGANRRNIKF